MADRISTSSGYSADMGLGVRPCCCGVTPPPPVNACCNNGGGATTPGTSPVAVISGISSSVGLYVACCSAMKGTFTLSSTGGGYLSPGGSGAYPCYKVSATVSPVCLGTGTGNVALGILWNNSGVTQTFGTGGVTGGDITVSVPNGSSAVVLVVSINLVAGPAYQAGWSLVQSGQLPCTSSPNSYTLSNLQIGINVSLDCTLPATASVSF
jgi:hypothetical protein